MQIRIASLEVVVAAAAAIYMCQFCLLSTQFIGSQELRFN